MKRLDERKILFTGSGAALEHVADQALAAPGFAVESGAPGRTDRVLMRKDARIPDGPWSCLITGLQLLCAWMDRSSIPNVSRRSPRASWTPSGCTRATLNGRDSLAEEQIAAEEMRCGTGGHPELAARPPKIEPRC